MYHGYVNERQRCGQHRVGKRGGRGKMAVNWTRANDRLLAVTSGSAALTKGLEVIGPGPVHCHPPLPPLFPTMCSSQRCPL